jgi:hypothetical protein
MDSACEAEDKRSLAGTSASRDPSDGAGIKQPSAFRHDRPSIKIRFGDSAADSGKENLFFKKLGDAGAGGQTHSYRVTEKNVPQVVTG